ncbi:MAG: threonine synthase [Candidatus Sericytochromatia bacterium]|nr:threonine synthase [Candidatus Sericytochromatia bacterium]
MQTTTLSANRWPGLIERYRAFLPVTAETPVITLMEGNTPLVPAPAVERLIGRGVKVFVKTEGANPTGSFKDRGMTMAITKAVEAGSEAVICASTGNTSASMAAYAGRAGLRSYLVFPHGYVAAGKLAQALAHGSNLLPISGNFDAALAIVREISATLPITLVNSVNPFRLEGQKTAGFEVCDQLGGPPDILAIPVGNAGNISAYWKGFSEYKAKGFVDRTPQMWGFQADGAAPIVRGEPVENPQTIATAIRIGKPTSWHLATAALAESQGRIEAVTDGEILEAYKLLAREVGVVGDPASPASVAGITKFAAFIPDGSTIVCVTTGHGLKDPDTAVKTSGVGELTPVAADLDAVKRALGLN